MGHLRPPHRDPPDVQLGTLGWDSPDVPLDSLKPHVCTFDAPKSDSIQNSIKNKIRNIHSKNYSFNRVQNIQWNYSFKKNEENYSKFQKKTKIWLRSPPETPV